MAKEELQKAENIFQTLTPKKEEESLLPASKLAEVGQHFREPEDYKRLKQKLTTALLDKEEERKALGAQDRFLIERGIDLSNVASRLKKEFKIEDPHMALCLVATNSHKVNLILYRTVMSVVGGTGKGLQVFPTGPEDLDRSVLGVMAEMTGVKVEDLGIRGFPAAEPEAAPAEELLEFQAAALTETLFALSFCPVIGDETLRDNLFTACRIAFPHLRGESSVLHPSLGLPETRVDQIRRYVQVIANQLGGLGIMGEPAEKLRLKEATSDELARVQAVGRGLLGYHFLIALEKRELEGNVEEFMRRQAVDNLYGSLSRMLFATKTAAVLATKGIGWQKKEVQIDAIFSALADPGFKKRLISTLGPDLGVLREGLIKEGLWPPEVEAAEEVGGVYEVIADKEPFEIKAKVGYYVPLVGELVEEGLLSAETAKGLLVGAYYHDEKKLHSLGPEGCYIMVLEWLPGKQAYQWMPIIDKESLGISGVKTEDLRSVYVIAKDDVEKTIVNIGGEKGVNFLITEVIDGKEKGKLALTPVRLGNEAPPMPEVTVEAVPAKAEEGEVPPAEEAEAPPEEAAPLVEEKRLTPVKLRTDIKGGAKLALSLLRREWVTKEQIGDLKVVVTQTHKHLRTGSWRPKVGVSGGEIVLIQEGEARAISGVIETASFSLEKKDEGFTFIRIEGCLYDLLFAGKEGDRIIFEPVPREAAAETPAPAEEETPPPPAETAPESPPTEVAPEPPPVTRKHKPLE